MTDSEQFTYRALSFVEFVDQYEKCLPKARLFELSLPWLAATEQFMLPENSQVIVHCLYQTNAGQEPVLSIAWPLVHNTNKSSQQQIKSLTSFYSSVAEPIFFTSPNKKGMWQLFDNIGQHHHWHSMLLGAFEEGLVAQVVVDYFPYQRLFSKTDNVYQEGITDYASYYQQRPSQLRNTIKRREKKLIKAHQYRTEVVTEVNAFPAAFTAYKTIYQQSWKGDEFSFDFIEQVCVAALAENKLRLGLLFVDDAPAAAQLWFLQTGTDCGVKGNSAWLQTKLQRTASIFKLAYTPKYQQYSVGSILSLVLSEHVISKDNVTSIEFGMGSEPYKKDWLTETKVRQSYQVFNPRSIYGKLAIIRSIVLPRLVKLFTRKSK
ncbi:GNAT family N-acetyltransferase [Colwellia sp. 12G3]|uniref:GNAT family N-acetyltransferase n=1 Tax=Colwellia sp. 12G3 TaxID=2058299 RepID=UPI0018E30517|nr:GNAT family N-acetyltransferase [Colwellia sp. 12G3]